MKYLFTDLLFFFTDPATTEIYTLSLHDALPIWGVDLGDDEPGQLGPGDGGARRRVAAVHDPQPGRRLVDDRSEEHTSELQSRRDLVCRLLLEKKKKIIILEYVRINNLVDIY